MGNIHKNAPEGRNEKAHRKREKTGEREVEREGEKERKRERDEGGIKNLGLKYKVSRLVPLPSSPNAALCR